MIFTAIKCSLPEHQDLYPIVSNVNDKVYPHTGTLVCPAGFHLKDGRQQAPSYCTAQQWKGADQICSGNTLI